MNSVPRSAISIADGEVTIDAGLLAAKLGLSVVLLKAEMRKGIVSGVTETGINEDVGRTRLTFRYHARVWAVVIEPDGNLVESIAPALKALPENTGRLSLPRLSAFTTVAPLSDFVRSSS